MEGKNIQKVYSAFFEGACYVLCLSWKAHKENDESFIPNHTLAQDAMEFFLSGYCNKDGYVTKPCECMNRVLGKTKYRFVEHTQENPHQGLNIARYSNGHFVVVNDQDEVVFDPGTGLSQKYAIASYRAFN